MTDFEQLLATLSAANVDFILVGGVAAVAHGASRLTQDLDVVYDREAENLQRIIEAFADLTPYPRNAPPGLPFQWDSETLARGLNFTLTTSAGDIDLLGEITGGGQFADLVDHCVTLDLYGSPCRCLDLETLIRVKRSVGRPKDYEAIAELEHIRQQRNESP